MNKTLLFFFTIFSTTQVFANTYWVTNSNDAGAGSLREAVSSANLNVGSDTVYFDASTNGNSILLTSGEILITDDILIQGNNSINSIVVGAGSGNVFTISPNINASFEKMKVSDADSGIFAINPVGDVSVVSCEMYNFNSHAIYYYSNFGDLLVDSCYIHDNGNGVWTQNSMDYTVTNSTFINNYTSGAILMAGGFMGNGLFANNTVYQNNYGIAIIDPQPGKATLIVNNTSVENTNTGIFVNEFYDNGAAVSMINNIAYNNGLDFSLSNMMGLGGANPLTLNNIMGTCMSDHGCPTWYSSSDPLLNAAGPMDNGGETMTISIDCSSPAYNAGTNSFGAPATDQRGVARYLDTDIGAYEYFDSGTDTQEACGSYTWIDGNTYAASTNTPTWVLTNAEGCDSTVTLNLTINPIPDNSVTQNGSELIANQLVAAYQWLDCDNNYAVINGEMNQSFTPDVTGNYAVEVNMNGCIDTSSCFLVDYTGIEELIQMEKELVKIVDFMGRETKYKPNTPLIFIYSDGTVERVMKLED